VTLAARWGCNIDELISSCHTKGEQIEMKASDYQEQAARTMIDQPGFEIRGHEIMAVWNALGLAGEAGEVAELVKKGVFHRHSIDRTTLEKEIGDVLWYAAALCTTLGLDLGEIMQANIEKLKVRYPNGYSSLDSQQRLDVAQE
jgi:NTP pyrophosphatase (non-canonical NTP hydrolase)